MTLTMACPKCGAESEPERIEDWAGFGTVPVVCGVCDCVLWVAVECVQFALRQVGDKLLPAAPVQANLPELPLGTKVQVTIREHSLYGQVGEIVEKRHRHYRVAVAGRRIMMPETGVAPYHG